MPTLDIRNLYPTFRCVLPIESSLFGPPNWDLGAAQGRNAPTRDIWLPFWMLLGHINVRNVGTINKFYFITINFAEINIFLESLEVKQWITMDYNSCQCFVTSYISHDACILFLFNYFGRMSFIFFIIFHFVLHFGLRLSTWVTFKCGDSYTKSFLMIMPFPSYARG